MMKDKLFVEEDGTVYRLTWLIAGDEFTGATLSNRIVPADDDCEHAIASKAAGECSPDGTDWKGYFWDTREAACKALRAANAALKSAKSAKPWPEWAKQAAAAGWKAPRGWEP